MFAGRPPDPDPFPTDASRVRTRSVHRRGGPNAVRDGRASPSASWSIWPTSCQSPWTGPRPSFQTPVLPPTPCLRIDRLLGVPSGPKHRGNQGGGVGSDGCGPADEALRRPLAHLAVLLGHVLVGGGMAPFERGAHVAGDALAAVDEGRQAMPTLAIGGSDPEVSGLRVPGWTDGAAEGAGGSSG